MATTRIPTITLADRARAYEQDPSEANWKGWCSEKSRLVKALEGEPKEEITTLLKLITRKPDLCPLPSGISAEEGDAIYGQAADQWETKVNDIRRLRFPDCGARCVLDTAATRLSALGSAIAQSIGFGKLDRAALSQRDEGTGDTVPFAALVEEFEEYRLARAEKRDQDLSGLTESAAYAKTVHLNDALFAQTIPEKINEYEVWRKAKAAKSLLGGSAASESEDDD